MGVSHEVFRPCSDKQVILVQPGDRRPGFETAPGELQSLYEITGTRLEHAPATLPNALERWLIIDTVHATLPQVLRLHHKTSAHLWMY